MTKVSFSLKKKWIKVEGEKKIKGQREKTRIKKFF